MTEKQKQKKVWRILMWVAIAIVAVLVVILLSYRDGYKIDVSKATPIVVTSPAFLENGNIPVQYTRRGEDISPELHVSELSPMAKSMAIVMEDLDFPPVLGGFSHWVIWNIPVQNVIPEGIPKGERLDSFGGAVQGIAFGRHCYGGPRPPRGTSHRYRFHVYALDTMLDLSANADKKELLQSIDGHVLQYGSLTGVYQ